MTTNLSFSLILLFSGHLPTFSRKRQTSRQPTQWISTRGLPQCPASEAGSLVIILLTNPKAYKASDLEDIDGHTNGEQGVEGGRLWAQHHRQDSFT